MNLDLSHFFESINYGRVRGYFIKNKYFQLDENIASAIAKICCYQNKLPQGSPCSPVVANLILSCLDQRLNQLCQKNGCTYSRYADDIAISTRRTSLPKSIIRCLDMHDGTVHLGKTLSNEIQRAGFSINVNKTRLQHTTCRQEVTGLTVNKKINSDKKYANKVRAMAHALFKTGKYERLDKKTGTVKEGTLAQLEGMLAFVDATDAFYREEQSALYQKHDTKKQPEIRKSTDGACRLLDKKTGKVMTLTSDQLTAIQLYIDATNVHHQQEQPARYRKHDTKKQLETHQNKHSNYEPVYGKTGEATILTREQFATLQMFNDLTSVNHQKEQPELCRKHDAKKQPEIRKNKNGEYELLDEKTKKVKTLTSGQLTAVLAFIETADVHHRGKQAAQHQKQGKKKRSQPTKNKRESVFADFLFYKNFRASTKPVLLTEGETDIVYLRAALLSLHENYPALIDNQNTRDKYKLRFFTNNERTKFFLNLADGSRCLLQFIKNYSDRCKKFNIVSSAHPIIVILDNDDGAKGLSLPRIENNLSNSAANSKRLPTKPWFHLLANLYLIFIPIKPGSSSSTMEDLFDEKTLGYKLEGKTFNKTNAQCGENQYGKSVFASKIVRKNYKTIDFSGFKVLFNAMQEIIKHQSELAANNSV